jgi:hypothetical protein
VITVAPSDEGGAVPADASIAFGGRGAGPENTKLYNPSAVLATSDAVFLSEYDNHRVLRIDASGTEVVAGGTGSGSAVTQLSSPRGIDLDGTTLYIAESNNHRISAWDTTKGRWLPGSVAALDGTFVGVVVAGVSGSSGNELSKLYHPRDVKQGGRPLHQRLL